MYTKIVRLLEQLIIATYMNMPYNAYKAVVCRTVGVIIITYLDMILWLSFIFARN